MEKLFKQKIEGLDSVPPGMRHDREASWSRIEAGLRKRRRRAAALWLSTAACLAIPIIWMATRTHEPKPQMAAADKPEVHLPAWVKEVKPNPDTLLAEATTPSQTTPPKAVQILALQDTFTYRFDGTDGSSITAAVQNQPTLYIDALTFNSLTANATSPITYTWASPGVDVTATGGTSPTVTGTYALSPNLCSGQSVQLITGGVPAEYGDLSGGVVQLGYLSSGRVGEQFEMERDRLFENGFDDANLGEGYSHFIENAPVSAQENAFSTFGLDVDVASYANIRRQLLTEGHLPPTDAVRIEEMVNYFDYEYREPTGSLPIEMIVESGPCPWNEEAQLVQIGMKAKEVDKANMPPSNLVFLIDVSGSMSEDLQLVKGAMHTLIKELRPQDRVSIVVYAGAAGEVLPSTPGSNKADIRAALDQLESGGSTAGGEGIELAYATALKHHKEGINSRVILCTDGDFNVGPSSNEELEEIIVRLRDQGVFLTCLGFGSGNYQDDMMELLADKGNGNYAYIDRQEEADRVFGKELTGTLGTIAKDVKLQVEWNPALVKTYRLVGYENRMLNKEDFENDSIDAGDVGAGHTVTAMYEVVFRSPQDQTDPGLQPMHHPGTSLAPEAFCGELMRLNMRYKKPEGRESSLMQWAIPHVPLTLEQTSDNFRWAASVASLGMMLRNSQYLKNMDYNSLEQLARTALAKDPDKERAEFIEMVKAAYKLSQQAAVDGK